MRILVRWGLVSLLMLSSLGCANYFKRKDCEKANWYKHGYDIAMRGERVTADSFVNECEKVEAEINYQNLDLGFKSGMGNYCKPETVFVTGKTGEPFKEDLCDAPNLSQLKVQYQKGLQVFCTAKSAKRYGAQGKVYKNVCPPELEERFMTPYREGRQIYLRGMVADKNKQILHLDGKIRQATRDRDRLSLQISGFRVLKTWVVKDVRDPRTGKVVRQRALEPDPRSLNERNRLQNSLNIRNNQIRDFEAKQEQLRMEVDTLNQELRALQVSQ